VERVGPYGSDVATVPAPQSGTRHLEIRLGRAWLQGELTIPADAKGLVLFVSGSGSSRLSARHRFVASELNQAGLATCLFDLLSLSEEQEDQAEQCHRFDVALLGQRLVEITDWIAHHLECALPIGYFGTGTGAAAAFTAATERPDLVKAVVSRSGRPDMAVHALHRLQAPALLLVGGLDTVVIELNRLAYRQLPLPLEKELVVIDGAGHWFEEPGKMAQVSQYATQWFVRYLANGTLD
jgi:pimeloyl-ACP methyl ester carboxylesterase